MAYSSELVQTLAQNQLILREDTLSDGNCGLHAFFLSLADFADRNCGLKQSRAWKALAKVKTKTAHLIKHLRRVAVEWMTDHADVEVWEGMRFRDLALRMSHLQEPYDDHLQRMSTDGEWVDASVIHALACVFRVDVAIWQAHQEPYMLGHSMSSPEDPPFGLVPIALKNDHHFWGVNVADFDHGPTKRKHSEIEEIEDWVRVPRARSDSYRPSDDEDEDDDNKSLPVVLDMTPDAMSSEEVDAELQFCGCLSSWVPWDVPDERVVSSLAAIRAPTTVRRCMLREQVVGDMIWEGANAEMPERLKYNAASRYRLQKDRLCPYKHVSKNTYMVAAKALKTHSKVDLELIRTALEKPCWRKRTIHHCMDDFKLNPQIIRTWRVMWRCLPKEVRREKLIHMMTPSY